MTEKYKVIEWVGGGAPIVTIMCLKSDWEALVKAGQENTELKRQLNLRGAKGHEKQTL